MIGNRHLINFLLLASLLSGVSAAVANDEASQAAAQNAQSTANQGLDPVGQLLTASIVYQRLELAKRRLQ